MGAHPVGFPIALQLRPLTPEEHDTIRQLAQSRTAAARTVERAKIIWLASHGRRVPAIAAELRLGGDTVRLWLKRFNGDGLAGLRDRPRAGRPATYTTEQVGEVVALSLTDPRSLGLPFASWTLDRLRAYLHEVKGLPISRARIGKVLVAEGLRWRTQETWFGERVDPAFAEKSRHALTGSSGDENRGLARHTVGVGGRHDGRGRPSVLRARKKSGQGAARKHRVSLPAGKHAEQRL